MTRSFDGLQAGITLLPAHSLQFLEGRGLSNVFPEDGDVDVFGEAFNQAVAFGKRRAPFEEQAWATGLQFIEERVKCPANAEVFLDVLLVCAEPVGGAHEKVAALFVARG
nr:hypothetical protein [Granulicella paludicola]